MDFLGSNLNFNMAQAQQLGLELFAADPTENLVQGRIYYNTTDNRIRLYNGTEWTSCGVSDIPAATATDLGGIKLQEETEEITGYKHGFDSHTEGSELVFNSFVITDKPWISGTMSGEPIRWALDDKPTIIYTHLGGPATDAIVAKQTLGGTEYWVIETPNGLQSEVLYIEAPEQTTTPVTVAPEGAVQLDSQNRAFVSLSGFSKHKEFDFPTPATSWVVEHNLGYRPAVTLVDADDNLILSDVHYDSENQLTVSFLSPQTGKVYLN